MALGDVISRLSVELSLNSAAFEQGSAKAAKSADALGDRMEKLGNRVGSTLKALAVAGGFGALLGGFEELIVKSLEYASSLDETAQQIGVTSAALQEYRYAATQVGISQEEMDAGLAKLTKTMGMAAAGGKQQYAVFAELSKMIGTDILKSAKDAGDAIPLIADALGKIKDPAERARIETELFGKAGQKLDTLLSGGSSAVNQLRDAAHDLGIVLSEKEIQDADKLADKLSELKMVLSAKISGAVADNANAILQLGESFKELGGAVEWASQKMQAFQGWFRKYTALRQAENGLTPGVRQAGKMNYQDAVAGEILPGMSIKDFAYGAGKGPAAPKPTFARDVTAPKSGGGSKPRGGGSKGPDPEKIEKRFNDELARYADQTLSARASMADTAEQAAEYDLRGVEISRLRTLEDIKLNKDYSETQKNRLGLEVEDLAEAQRAKINYQLQRTQEDQAADLSKEQVDGQRERLDGQLALAGTEIERQKIALELFDLDQEEKRQSLERIVHSSVRTAAEKALAQTALDNLNANSGLARANAERSNETQVQSYLRGLEKTPQQINEAIDGIKIDGLKSLNDGLVDAIMGAKSLGDVFKNVANQIIADLLRIAIQKAVIAPIADALFGGTGGGGGLLSGIGHIFGFATGTPSAPPGLAWVGERGPELVNFRGGERVTPSNSSRGGNDGMQRVEIVDTTGLFRFAVNGQIMQSAPGIANAGADLAQRKSAYSQSRRLAA